MPRLDVMHLTWNISMDRVELLDCTIRDGGYTNNWEYDKTQVKDLYRLLSAAGIDIIELGFVTDKKYDKGEGIWRFCNEELLKEAVKKKKSKVGVMADFGKIDINKLPDSSESIVDIIRIATHKNNISQALDLIERLKDKGYTTSLQMMGYSTYTSEEQINIVDLIEDVNTDYVYIADSYGSLMPYDIKPLLQPLLEIPNIKIGFHAHNNLENAFSNTIEAIRCGVHIIDSSVGGIGRGSGNLKTELITSHIRNKYNPVPVLEYIDTYHWDLYNETAYILSSMFSCHPYYAREMINNKLTLPDMYDKLKKLQTLNPIGFNKELLKDYILNNVQTDIIKDDYEIVALMPMKGHSERIPHKNMRLFNGKPLFYWMLSKLVNSKLIDKVVVDTDSPIISGMIQKDFPEVILLERPEELCGDLVSMNDIIGNDIVEVYGDIYLQTHSTNPLLKIDTINTAIKCFIDNDKNDSLFGVTKLNKMFWSHDGVPINHSPVDLIRTQDLSPVYEENSNMYIFTKDSFVKHRSRIGDTPYMFEIPRDESFDIDEMIDFRIAESLHKRRNYV